MKDKRSGQSLIEILIALAIGSILIGAASLGIAFMLRSSNTNQSLQSASGLVREIIEKLRAWSSADWQNVYSLDKGLATKYFLNASGTLLMPIKGEEGIVESEVRTNLIGRWGFDEATGTLAYDMSGNSNTGTLVLGPTRATGTACAVGGCLGLDGVSQYISIQNPPNPPLYTTVTGWFKRSGVPAGGYHIIFMQGTQVEISIPDPGGQIRTGVTTATLGRQVFNSGSGLTDGNWHFLSFTYDGANLIAYIDGAQTTSTAVSGALTTGSATNIGYLPGYLANGFIDDVRIYDRALTSGEIERLYKSRKFTRYFSIEDTCRSSTASTTVDTSPCDGGYFEDPSTQKVTAVVRWPTTQTIAELRLVEFLTRWKNEVFHQQDWSGGSGQDGPISVPNNRFASSTNIDVDSQGVIKIQGL